MYALHLTGRITWILFSLLLWAPIVVFVTMNVVSLPHQWYMNIGFMAIAVLGFWLGWLTPDNASLKWLRRLIGYTIACAFTVLVLILLFLAGAANSY